MATKKATTQRSEAALRLRFDALQLAQRILSDNRSSGYSSMMQTSYQGYSVEQVIADSEKILAFMRK